MPRRTMLSVVILALALATLHAQEPLPSFEVASVRENISGQNEWFFSRGLMPNMFGQFISVPGQISITNAPLRVIIARAYAVLPEHARFILRGGPEACCSSVKRR